MKTIIILFCFTIIISELSAQNLSGAERLDSIHHWKMHPDAEQWKPYLKVAITRDEYDNIIQKLSFCPQDDTTWGETVWDNHNLNLSFFNNENQLIEDQYYYWYDSTWINEFKNFHSYDAIGNVIESYSQYWFSQEWVNTSRITKTYNPDQTVDSLIQYGWDENNWNAYSWTDHAYNAEGLIEIEHTRSHVMGNIFDESRKYYTYNNQNQLLEVTVQNPVGPIGSGLWGDLARTVYSYDNFTVTQTHQEISQNGWVNSLQNIYQYQNENLTIELHQSWDEENEKWVSRDSIYYYYSTETATNEFAEVGSLKLYPNPVSNIFQISTTEGVNDILINAPGRLIIYSSSGERMLITDMDGNNKTLDVSNFLPGTYFVVLRNGMKRNIGTLIKQ